jgi:hypothetical protein
LINSVNSLILKNQQNISMRKFFSIFISAILVFSTFRPIAALATSKLEITDCNFEDSTNDELFFKNFVFAFYPVPYMAEQLKYENGFFEEIEIRTEELYDIIPDTIDDLLSMASEAVFFVEDIQKEVVDLFSPYDRPNTGPRRFGTSSRGIGNLGVFTKDPGEEKKGKIDKEEKIEETLIDLKEKTSEIFNIAQYAVDEFRIIYYGIIEAANLILASLSKIYYFALFIQDFFGLDNQDFFGLDKSRSIESIENTNTFDTEIPWYRVNDQNLMITGNPTDSERYSLSDKIIKSKLKSAKKYKNESEADFFFTSDYNDFFKYTRKTDTRKTANLSIDEDIIIDNAKIDVTATTTPKTYEVNRGVTSSGVPKYNNAIPGDIVLTDKLIRSINNFLLTYVDLLMELEELDLLLYGNPKLTATAVQDTVKRLSIASGQFGLHDRKMMVNDIKRSVKSSAKIKSLFSTLDRSLNKIHDEIISQRKDQYNYKTALKDVIKNAFLAKKSCLEFVEEYNKFNIDSQKYAKYDDNRKRELILNFLKSSSYRKIMSYSKNAEKALSKLCLIDAEKFGANLYNRGDGHVDTPQKYEIIALYNGLKKYMTIKQGSFDNNCVIFKQFDPDSNFKAFFTDNSLSSINGPSAKKEAEKYPEALYYPVVSWDIFKKVTEDAVTYE